MVSLQKTTEPWTYLLDLSSSHLREERDFFEQTKSGSHA